MIELMMGLKPFTIRRNGFQILSIILIGLFQLTAAKSAEEELIAAVEKAALALPADSFLEDIKLVQKVAEDDSGQEKTTYKQDKKTIFVRKGSDDGKVVIVLRSSEDHIPKRDNKRTFVVLRQDPSAKTKYSVFYAYVRTASPNTPSDDIINLEDKKLTIEWDSWDNFRGSPNLGKLFGHTVCGHSVMATCKLSALDVVDEGNEDDIAKEIVSTEPDYSEESTDSKSSKAKKGGGPLAAKTDLFVDLEIDEKQKDFTTKTIRYIALAEAIVKSVRPSLKTFVDKYTLDVDWSGQLGSKDKPKAGKETAKKLLDTPRDEVSASIGKAANAFMAGIEDIAATALALKGDSDTKNSRDALLLLGTEILGNLLTTPPTIKEGIQVLSPNPVILLQQEIVEAISGKGPLVALASITGKSEADLPMDEVLDLDATANLLDDYLPKFVTSAKVPDILKPGLLLHQKTKEFLKKTKDIFKGDVLKDLKEGFTKTLGGFGSFGFGRKKRSPLGEELSSSGRGLLDGLLAALNRKKTKESEGKKKKDPKDKKKESTDKGSKEKKSSEEEGDGDAAEKRKREEEDMEAIRHARGLLNGLINKLSKKKEQHGKPETKPSNEKEKKKGESGNKKKEESKKEEPKKEAEEKKEETEEKKEESEPAEKRKREGDPADAIKAQQAQQAALLRALLLAQAQKRAAEMNKQAQEASQATGVPPPPPPPPTPGASPSNDAAKQQLLMALLGAEAKMKQAGPATAAAGKDEGKGGGGPLGGLSGTLNGILDSLTGGDGDMLHALISGSDGGPNDVLNTLMGPGGEMVNGLLQGLNMDSLLGGIDGGLISSVLGGMKGIPDMAKKMVGGFMKNFGFGGSSKGGSGASGASGGGSKGGKGLMGGMFGRKKRFAHDFPSSDIQEIKEDFNARIPRAANASARGLLSSLGSLGKLGKKKPTGAPAAAAAASPKQEGADDEKEDDEGEGEGAATTVAPAAKPEHKKNKLLSVLKLGRRKRAVSSSRLVRKVKKAKSSEEGSADAEGKGKKQKKKTKASEEGSAEAKTKKTKKKKKSSGSTESAESESHESSVAKTNPFPPKQKKTLGLLGLLGRRKRSFNEARQSRRKRNRVPRDTDSALHVPLTTNQDLFSRVGWYSQNDLNGPDVKDLTFLGWGPCKKSTNVSFEALQKDPASASDFYLSALRMQCLPMKLKMIIKLIKHDLIAYDETGVFTVSAQKLKNKKKLSPKESEELSVAFEIAAFTQTYLEVVLKKEEPVGPIKFHGSMSKNAYLMMLFCHKYLERISEKAPAHLVMLQRNLVMLLRTAIVRLVADYHKYAFESKYTRTQVTHDLFNLEGLVSFIINGKDDDILTDSKDSNKLYKIYLEKNSNAIDKAVLAYFNLDSKKP